MQMALSARKNGKASPPACLLTPAETEGPYYFNANLVRQDVTEGKPGIPLRLRLTVVNQDCVPIPNALVDIWHCDATGVYSGYAGQGSNGNVSTVGQTFIRGIQVTDAAGQVEFHTIYPGWYPGRVTHIHIKVNLSSTTAVTSQLYFPENISSQVYGTSEYSAHGQSPLTNSSDSIARNDASQLLLDVATDGNGYLGTHTIGISAIASVNDSVRETGGQFSMQRNFPNPFSRATTITFSLLQSSKVDLTVFNVEGKPVARLLNERMGAGEHKIDWDISSGARVAAGNYLCQLTVKNDRGEFRQTQVATVR
ncbi:MAG: T9SS type A sorting domain-containing protein [Bacteroidota bacterium]